MPMYDYKCQKCGSVKELILPMEHETPTGKDIKHLQNCKDTKPLQRIFHATAISWGGVRGTTDRPTDSTSATREKNEKINKLYNDSIVPDL